MTTVTRGAPAPAPGAAGGYLSVRDLQVRFATEDGTVKAVDGLSFDLERGRTLGVVGESGSGKSVTSLTVLGLHDPRTTTVEGQILLEGQELTGAGERALESLRGNKIAMIFQDPLTALSPYYTVGRQIAEPYRKHTGASKRAARNRTRGPVRAPTPLYLAPFGLYADPGRRRGHPTDAHSRRPAQPARPALRLPLPPALRVRRRGGRRPLRDGAAGATLRPGGRLPPGPGARGRRAAGRAEGRPAGSGVGGAPGGGRRDGAGAGRGPGAGQGPGAGREPGRRVGGRWVG